MYDCLTHYYPSQTVADLPGWLPTAVTELKPGGLLSVRDVVVPGSRLRGKKADLQRQAGGYVNAFLQMSGWQPAWSQVGWEDRLRDCGLAVVFVRVTAVSYTFHDWALHLPPPARLRLHVLLKQAPAPVIDYLTPHFAGDRIAFHLHELWMVGKK
ncbi:MAG: hypothetical protein HND44_09590 [Chloroflexi bacterium]|nr:hypothetical protein [Ardenticatenaceae bacterium]MBL1128732.1 hypothetical protein [Chloroflexota bacterium]NOG34810.1 hypothetical protein [Chloroflexota bacterium]GIK55876.1 MAG: hypothetical protein BroJett015_15390 [Chloroflexota bacterium]